MPLCLWTRTWEAPPQKQTLVEKRTLAQRGYPLTSQGLMRWEQSGCSWRRRVFDRLYRIWYNCCLRGATPGIRKLCMAQLRYGITKHGVYVREAMKQTVLILSPYAAGDDDGGAVPSRPDFPFPPPFPSFFERSSASIRFASSQSFFDASRNRNQPSPSRDFSQTFSANFSCAPPGANESMYFVTGTNKEESLSEMLARSWFGSGATSI